MNACFLYSSYVDVLIPSVAVFGDGTFKEKVRLNNVIRVGT